MLVMTLLSCAGDGIAESVLAMARCHHRIMLAM
jgi:hypothetical protein